MNSDHATGRGFGSYNKLIIRNIGLPIGTSIYGAYQKTPSLTKDVCGDSMYSQ